MNSPSKPRSREHTPASRIMSTVLSTASYELEQCYELEQLDNSMSRRSLGQSVNDASRLFDTRDTSPHIRFLDYDAGRRKET